MKINDIFMGTVSGYFYTVTEVSDFGFFAKLILTDNFKVPYNSTIPRSFTDEQELVNKETAHKVKLIANGNHE